MKKNIAKDLLTVLAIIFIGIIFLFFFKIKHSMNFLNLDELLWMYRSRFFIENIVDFNFSNLIQSAQPGIMVMWLVGPFMKIINYDFNLIANLISNLNSSGIGYNIINSNFENQQIYNEYKNISFLFNISIFATIFLFIFSTFYLLQKLEFNKWIIIFSLLLIVTTPYYIYFTTPTDKLVGIFSIISILSLLIYSSNRGNKKFLFTSAILCSWAVLTKMSALFLVPFSLFILIFYKLNSDTTTIYHYKNATLLNFYKDMKNTIKDYFYWLAIFILTSIIFLPTIITNPQSVKKLIITEGSSRSVAENSISTSFNIVLTYLSDSFILSFNFFVIIIFLGFILLIIWRVKNRIKVNKEILTLTIYFISFFIFIAIFSKIYSFRYLTPILLVFQIIAGTGIYELANIFIKKNNISNKKFIYSWVIIFILISQGLLIYYSEIKKIENMPYFG